MQRTAHDPLPPAGLKKIRRPPGRLCSTCLKRELSLQTSSLRSSEAIDTLQSSFKFEDPEAQSSAVEVFRLKLRDWFGVERVELVPCLSVCPEKGIASERRGTSIVLDAKAIELIQKQFDPTRQLSLFDVL